MKRIIGFLLILSIIVSFAACNLEDRATKESIISFVLENEESILKCIETGDYTSIENNKPITEINFEKNCVDFYCGGMGFGAGSMYVGFFYSEEDDIKAVWCAPSLPEHTLIPCDDGYIWKEVWTDEGGDNTYYAEKICENIYYYEAHF